MRLIDADILKPEFVHGRWDARYVAEHDIVDAPTVDASPVKHGHWIRGESYPHHIYCSRCYRTYVPNDEMELWKDWTILPRKYCPECGASMDEVKES